MGFKFNFLESDNPDLTNSIIDFDPQILIVEDKLYYFIIEKINSILTKDDIIKKILIFNNKNILKDKGKFKKSEFINTKNFLIVLDKCVKEIINKNQNIYLVSSNKKILFVDDDKTIHIIADSIFYNTNISILHAYNGNEGYINFKEFKPDIIFANYDLPLMSGFELCKLIKKERTQYIPVILLSRLDNEIDINSAFEIGADDYIIKPIDPEVLVGVINNYLLKIEKKTRYKILLVDDSKLIVEVVSQALIRNNLNVLIAFDGQEAYEIAKKEIPDVIITDINMPKMNGYELCKIIKKTPSLGDTSIIIMSCLDKISDIKKGEKLGITYYITKPFDSEKITMLVDRILMEKSNLYKREYENMLASINALITALEARDIYTKGHTKRVSGYSKMLAKYLGFSSYQVDEIELGSNMHDIGKIGIRDDILLKTDLLTEEEYKKIKEHPVIGAEILSPIKSLKHIIPFVIHHHERWDGKGYPDGLKGVDIPLGARIIALADTYDAVTSDRPYKKTLSKKEAIQLIEKELGSQFCPETGKKFVEMMISS